MKGNILAALLRALYTCLMLLALPFMVMRLFWKSLKLPTYRARISERLGSVQHLKVPPGGFLVHAVSVGEVVLTIPIIRALKLRYPQMSITLTTTTPTGSQRVKQTFDGEIHHAYFPYDLPWMVNAFLDKVRPACVIIMETELWPNFIYRCRANKIPVIIANGRLSDNSMRRYVWIKFFMAKILPQLTYVTAQSELDGQRFVQLGLPAHKLQVIGNLKFEATIQADQHTAGTALKAALGRRLIWVAASTHAGEEELILQALKAVQEQFPHVLLVLIPRHPDRFEEVAALLTAKGLHFARRSAHDPYTTQTQVLLGDSMGELGMYYAMADIAYVGGSLVPVGGHNVLEPAMLGVATITGQHYHNFKDITLCLQKANALSVVNTVQELEQEVIELLLSPELRVQRGSNAIEVIDQNRGALQKLIGIINIKLASCKSLAH